MKNIIVAIDGYSSCGKSTVAKAVAKQLNFVYIDSGAMYRAVTVYFLENKIQITDEEQIKMALLNVHIKFNNVSGKTIVLLNENDISERIREMEISEYVCHVSALKQVRVAMVEQQQKMADHLNIIMDGRDIGTTVFPNAQVKIFMTADPKVRADRRYLELQASNQKVTIEEVFNNLAHRDYEDTTRQESPLIHSKDATTLDNTNLTHEEQLNFVIDLVREAIFEQDISLNLKV
ncbi:(d)CMP kinase [Pedobacter sp. HMWF019]|nr:(d)CMP kinase [Pedobacter sp. HMWF019]